MNKKQLLLEINDKYSEWFEMVGEDSPALMISILSSLLIKEMDHNDYLNKRLDHAIYSSTN